MELFAAIVEDPPPIPPGVSEGGGLFALVVHLSVRAILLTSTAMPSAG